MIDAETGSAAHSSLMFGQPLEYRAQVPWYDVAGAQPCRPGVVRGTAGAVSRRDRQKSALTLARQLVAAVEAGSSIRSNTEIAFACARVRGFPRPGRAGRS